MRRRRPVTSAALAGAALGLAACVLAAACDKKASSSPMAVQMRDIDKTWALLLTTLEEKGPFQAQPYVTQLAGMFRSDAITGSELYRNPDFKKKNDDMIDALEKLDSAMGQRIVAEIGPSRSDAQGMCKYCHNQFWDKARERRQR
jgi:cytochrome c556